MTNFVYIAASLDGFIATEDDGIDWLTSLPNPEHSDFGFGTFIAGIDALVMGRRTFEKVLSFGSWPYTKPVFVLSRTLSTVPDELAGRVEILAGDPGSVVERLSERGHRDLYIDGGVTIQEFLRHDLIDTMIITRVPILLGAGIPLFGRLDGAREFTVEKVERLTESLVQTTYRRAREDG